ncbi:hypothetical protein DOTSEDRAFT_70630 [Dothistroma septosporum NZE10]|uniref:Uncharacterized protein n=1 Tax=Dothistroma septosporum (strain NZE10 / CBS 128990) TaxID=675120 RepID=N1PWE4_DOTSN|nr:hypothetical protein DOTSEDRAFT_70630 [Dothistroma septosporum NZE10]
MQVQGTASQALGSRLCLSARQSYPNTVSSSEKEDLFLLQRTPPDPCRINSLYHMPWRHFVLRHVGHSYMTCAMMSEHLEHNAVQPTAADLRLANLQRWDEEALDVLDLPQLYTKPSAQTLLGSLAQLSSNPPSWDTTPRTTTPRSARSGISPPYSKRRRVRCEGIAPYLTRIIASALSWIEDDNQKEQIWEAASQRLSERSGRSAMGAITRTFVIDMQPSSILERSITRNPSSDSDGTQMDASENNLELTLHEPALTSDNLGLKTWASSYLLAKRLGTLRAYLPSLPRDALILELGAGTGLVGLAAAAVFSRHVILTDLPEIVENLQRNVQTNAPALTVHGAKAYAAVLDWTSPASFTLENIHPGGAGIFPLILVADPIYSTEHPRFLTQAILYHLSRDDDARVIIELPLREAYVAERQDLHTRMAELGLSILHQGEEVGFDDWSSGHDEVLTEVRCWWSVWARS